MIYQINPDTKTIDVFKSNWTPKEIELERYLLPKEGTDDPILESSVFGEPLILISNQVKTRLKKRADILALDKAGSSVIIELKRDSGVLGLETQALQYLADFSAYKGQDFIARFSRYSPTLKEHILGFLGYDVRVEDINKQSRIILIARGFDPVIFSMGEWLSEHGVAFRCIEYTPFEISDNHFLTFSVAFDRSPESLYPLIFQSRAREPGYFWHNIGFEDNDWWHFLVKKGQINTGFDNRPGDQGERILKNYISGDVIVAYCSGYGAIGWGVIENPSSYRLIKPNDPDDYWKGIHLHRLDIVWKVTAPNIDDGMRADIIRNEFGIYHPVSTSARIDNEKAQRLIKLLSEKFSRQQALAM